jgi:hypothetical protein
LLRKYHRLTYRHAHGEKMTKVLDATLLLPLLDSARDGGDQIVLGKDFLLPDAHINEDGGAVVCDERR